MRASESRARSGADSSRAPQTRVSNIVIFEQVLLPARAHVSLSGRNAEAHMVGFASVGYGGRSTAAARWLSVVFFVGGFGVQFG